MSVRSCLALLSALPLLVAGCGGGGAAITVSLQPGSPDPWAGVVTVRLEADGPSMDPIRAEAARTAGELDLPPVPFGSGRTILVEGLDAQRFVISSGQSAPFEVSASGPSQVSVPFSRCGQVYRDGDGDGYGGPASARTGCSQTGWVGQGGDCDDTDASAHPGQKQFFTVPTKGTSNYDYDCDGNVTQQNPGTCTATKPQDCKGDGWLGTVPACGDEGQLGSCAWQAGCSVSRPQTATQACR